MTFEEKFNYFNRYARFDVHQEGLRKALSFVRKHSPSARTDFSFKCSHDRIFFDRFNIGPFREDQKYFYGEWCQLIREIGRAWKINWPDKQFQAFMDTFDWSSCHTLHIGFDFSPPVKNSRLKLWLGLRLDRQRMEQLAKDHLLTSNILYGYWKKYNPGWVLLGWVYSGSGQAAWRVYPEMPSAPLVVGSNNPVVQRLGRLSGKVLSLWPSQQNIIYWDKIKNNALFLKTLRPLLANPHGIKIANEFQTNGLSLSMVTTNLPASGDELITESNFYFV